MINDNEIVNLNQFITEIGAILPADSQFRAEKYGSTDTWNKFITACRTRQKSVVLPVACHYQLFKDASLADLVFAFSSELRSEPKLMSGRTSMAFSMAALTCDALALRQLLKDLQYRQSSLELLMQSSEDQSICDEVAALQSLKPWFVKKDGKGIHALQYAAMAGNDSAMQFILELDGVIESLSLEDKKAILDSALLAGNRKCVIMFASYCKFSPQTAITALKETDPDLYNKMADIVKYPLITAPEIDALLDSDNDQGLYNFINQFDNEKLTIQDYYVECCVTKLLPTEIATRIMQRLYRLELSPLMLQPNIDIDKVIDLQKTIARKYSVADPVDYFDIHKSCRLFKEALAKNDFSTCHSIMHRRKGLLQFSIKGAVYEAIKLGNIKLVRYFIKQCLFADDPEALLKHAISNNQLNITQFLMEEYQFNSIHVMKDCDNRSPLTLALQWADHPCVNYLLNSMPLVGLENVSKQLTAQVVKQNLILTKETCQRILAIQTHSQSVPVWIFLQNLFNACGSANKNMVSALVRPDLDSLNLSIRFLYRLVELENVPEADALQELLIELQVVLRQELQALAQVTPLPESISQQLAAYDATIAAKYAACSNAIDDPFTTEDIRKAHRNILVLSKRYGRLNAADVLQQAYQSEARALKHFLENKRGYRVKEFERIKVLANVEKIKEAVDLLEECNRGLAIILANAAEKGNKNAEKELITLAGSVPFAKMKLGLLQLQRYEAATLTFLYKSDGVAARRNLLTSSFPETLLPLARCFIAGIGGEIDVEQGLSFLYFAAKKTHDEQAQAQLTAWQNKKRDPKTLDFINIAHIYLKMLANDFEPSMSDPEHRMSQCILKVVKRFNNSRLQIQLLQLALEYAANDSDAIHTKISTVLSEIQTEAQFIETISALKPQNCIAFALRYVHDNTLSSKYRCLLVVAAGLQIAKQSMNIDVNTIASVQYYLEKIAPDARRAYQIALQGGEVSATTTAQAEAIAELQEKKSADSAPPPAPVQIAPPSAPPIEVPQVSSSAFFQPVLYPPVPSDAPATTTAQTPAKNPEAAI